MEARQMRTDVPDFGPIVISEVYVVTNSRSLGENYRPVILVNAHDPTFRRTSIEESTAVLQESAKSELTELSVRAYLIRYSK